MMKRFAFISYIALLCIILMCFSGCESILKREFISTERHETALIEDKVSSQMTSISDYESLKQALVTAVEEHNSSLSVKLSGYTGDVDQDINEAITHVLSTSIAAYGVSDITYESTLILSYYEINFNITYSRTKEEFFEIFSVSAISQFRNAINDCLKSFGTEITFRFNDIDLEKYDLSDMILQTYYSNPFYALGLVDYETSYYPAKNDNCIMKIEFKYSDSYAALTTKRLQTEDAFNRIVNNYSGRDNDQERIKYFHDALCETCSFVETTDEYDIFSNITPDDSFTIYGALVKGEACSYGYSLALQALCENAGMTSMLVNGSANGEIAQWNVVYIGSNWYHVDCAADDVSDELYGYGSFCLPDRFFTKYYIWASPKHGYCNSNNVRYNYNFTDNTEWLSRYNPTGTAPDTNIQIN